MPRWAPHLHKLAVWLGVLHRRSTAAPRKRMASFSPGCSTPRHTMEGQPAEWQSSSHHGEKHGAGTLPETTAFGGFELWLIKIVVSWAASRLSRDSAHFLYFALLQARTRPKQAQQMPSGLIVCAHAATTFHQHLQRAATET